MRTVIAPVHAAMDDVLHQRAFQFKVCISTCLLSEPRLNCISLFCRVSGGRVAQSFIFCP